MSSIAERGMRILDAASDIEVLLRLAHEAVHHIHQDVNDSDFEYAEQMSEKIHQLRQEAKQFNLTLQKHVREMES